MTRRFGGLGLCLWMGLWMACGPRVKPAIRAPMGPGETSPKDLRGMAVNIEDRNHDGKPDKWTECSLAGGLKRCEKLDLDYDGKVDVLREYDDAGLLTVERRDLDYDGRIDDERTFTDGVITEERSGFGFDGKWHHWTFFENGKKVREEVDINQDGRVDEWRYFENDKLVRIGTDSDGDGLPDSFRR